MVQARGCGTLVVKATYYLLYKQRSWFESTTFHHNRATQVQFLYLPPWEYIPFCALHGLEDKLHPALYTGIWCLVETRYKKQSNPHFRQLFAYFIQGCNAEVACVIWVHVVAGSSPVVPTTLQTVTAIFKHQTFNLTQLKLSSFLPSQLNWQSLGFVIRLLGIQVLSTAPSRVGTQRYGLAAHP